MSSSSYANNNRRPSSDGHMNIRNSDGGGPSAPVQTATHHGPKSPAGDDTKDRSIVMSSMGNLDLPEKEQKKPISASPQPAMKDVRRVMSGLKLELGDLSNIVKAK